MEIILRNSGFNIKGNYNILSKEQKNFIAKISRLTIRLPFYLIRDEKGLVTEVDTSAFTMNLDKADIDLEFEANEMIENMAAHLIKSVLKLIKKNIIEKNLVKIMNEKLGEVFHNLNDIILNKDEPEELNILIDESKRSNLMNSSIIGSISYILNSLIGVNGSLNFNDLVNIFTYNSGIFNLKSIYEKDLEFQLNFSKKNNISFGNLLIILDDLNISGLNTWIKKMF